MTRTLKNNLSRLLPLVLAAACPLAAAGCLDNGDNPGDIQRPPSIERPAPDAPANRNASTLPTVPLSQIASPAASGDPVLAEVSGVRVKQSEVVPTLIEAYGLDVLLKVVQLNMAKAEAARDGITVSPADVERERHITMQFAFPGESEADYPSLLKQLLERQHVSEVEFNLVMQTNAYLRGLVAHAAQAQITDEMVRNEFNATYGERVHIRHIALANMQEVAEAQARLAGGAPFQTVAQNMSRYATTARLGGDLPPFSRLTPGVSRAMVDAAFTLTTPGQVSTDPVYDGTFYHLIQLVERIPPSAVKFEDVRDSVRQSLARRLEQIAMGNLRNQMAERARRELNILEPTMARQFRERLEAANPATQPTTQDAIDRRIEQTRDNLTRARESATAPATAPAHTPMMIMPRPATTAPTAP